MNRKSAPQRILKVGLVQQHCNDDGAHNLKVSMDGVRDAAGRGVDTIADPAPHIVSHYTTDRNSYLFSGTRLGATAIDNRSRILGQLEELEKTSLDFYATVRSLYIQKRRDDIRNGGSGEPVPIPEISFERDDSIQQQRSSATTR